MRNYEIMVILSGALDQNARATIIKEIESNFSKIVKKDDWGMTDFAYEIKKAKAGYYIVYYVKADIDKIEQLKHISRIKSEIVRLMIIKHDEWPSVYKLS